VVVLQHQHPRACRDNQSFGRRGHAVRNRRDQRDVAGIGMDQARCGAAGALVLIGGERLVDHHGRPLRATPARPASWTASGSGLHPAALK
jgi:hypothetical protein